MKDIKFRVLPKTKLPEKRFNNTWRDKLEPLLSNLEPENYIEITLPEGTKTSGLTSGWHKVCEKYKKTPRTRELKQPDGSYIVCVWWENGIKKG
jgi:hypothetical protein